jgi:hypothetical protein
MFTYFRYKIFQAAQVLDEWTSLQKIVIYQNTSLITFSSDPGQGTNYLADTFHGFRQPL